MEKVNQSYISEELIKIFKSSKKFFTNLESLDLKVSYKNDNSPLTILDTEVDNFIRKELKKINKDFSFISEEISQEQTNSKYTQRLMESLVPGNILSCFGSLKAFKKGENANELPYLGMFAGHIVNNETEYK